MENHNEIHSSVESLCDQSLDSPVKMRCPDCFQLYSVSPLEFKTSRPKFECQKCTNLFWISYPECLELKEVLGFPLSWLYPDQSPESQESIEPKNNEVLAVEQAVKGEQAEANHLVTKECPSCEHKNEFDQQECRSCGLVFNKFHQTEADEPRSNHKIRESWSKVLENFTLEESHSSFIEQCQLDSCLEYAAYKYQYLLESCPNDELVISMHKRVNALVLLAVNVRSKPVKAQSKNKLASLFSLWSLLFLFCAGVIAAGLVLPGFKNLVGIGVALLFLGLSIRYYAGQNKSTPF